MVSTVAPSHCTASIRQPRTISPSTRTVQAPQTPCSQPTWLPVSAQVLAQEIDQRLARLDAFGDALAVDGERDVEGVLAHAPGLHQLRGHAAQQHAGEMLLHGAGRLQVVGRVEIERGNRGIDIAGGERGFGFLARAAPSRRRRKKPAARP